MTPRRARTLFLILLLATGIVAILSSPAPPTVRANLLLVTLTPTSGPPGTVVDVSATGASVAAGTLCSITSNGPAGFVTNSLALVDGAGIVKGTFKVGSPVASGLSSAAYTVTVNCPASAVDSGSQPFQVTPLVTLSAPINLAAGYRKVTVTGTGFASDANSCTITGSAGIIFSSETSCTISVGGVSATSYFIHDPTKAPGPYTITVTPNKGLLQTASYQLVASPTIEVCLDTCTPGPGTVSAPVGFGTIGGGVVVFGGGFANGTRSCSLSATVVTIANLACTIKSDGTVTAGFSIASVAGPGNVVVTDPGPLVSATCTTCITGTAAPTAVTFTSTGTVAGSVVSIIGGGANFQKLDAGPCTLASTPPNLPSNPQSCIIDRTGAVVFSVAPSPTRFTVGNAAGQPYNLLVTSLNGVSSTPSVGAYTVTAFVTLNPTSGSPPLGINPGSTIMVTGTGFKPIDSTCTIASAAPPLVKPGYSCTISLGTGVLSGQFVVDSAALDLGVASHVITVTGVQGVDAAPTVTFTVVPIISLTPTSGIGGTVVAVAGSGFASFAGPCVLTSSPVGLPLEVTPPCTQTALGTVSGSFTVNPAALDGAGYMIKVTSGAAPVDFATKPFSKGPGTAPQVFLTPNTGGLGATVVVNGTGFSPSDNGCMISSLPVLAPPVASPTGCVMASGKASGIFFVQTNPPPSGLSLITVTGTVSGTPNDFGTAYFSVPFVFTSTVTSTSSSSVLVSTSFSTATTTTNLFSTLTTTTLSTTARSTETNVAYTYLTLTGEATNFFTSLTSMTSTSTFLSTVFSTTTVASSTITATVTGFALRGATPDGLGILAVLILLAPLVVRRLFD